MLRLRRRGNARKARRGLVVDELHRLESRAVAGVDSRVRGVLLRDVADESGARKASWPVLSLLERIQMSLIDVITPQQTAAFWLKVDKMGPVTNPTLGHCWQWLGAPMTVGYGLITVGSGRLGTRKRALTHRLSWELHNGPIPAGTGHHGTVIMHKCDNRLCVNPAHLQAGTQRENLRDMADKGRCVTPGLRGSRSPRSKLTPEQVRRVRFGNEPGRALAREFGVSHTAIRLIRKGDNWRVIE